MYRTLIYLEGLAIYPVMNVQAVLIAKTGQLITDSQLAVYSAASSSSSSSSYVSNLDKISHNEIIKKETGTVFSSSYYYLSVHFKLYSLKDYDSLKTNESSKERYIINDSPQYNKGLQT
jgi:hypothetical protein